MFFKSMVMRNHYSNHYIVFQEPIYSAWKHPLSFHSGIIKVSKQMYLAGYFLSFWHVTFPFQIVAKDSLSDI